MGRIIVDNRDPILVASIDIDEPIAPISPGDTKEVGFTYSAGDPPAFGFLMEWFRRHADAEVSRYQLDPARYALPIAEILPVAPVAGAVDVRGIVRFTMPTVDDVINPRIPASIDIDEPIVVAAGTAKNVAFTYDPGDPPAFGFLMEWFWAEADAEADRNKLTSDIPQTQLSPEIPLITPGTHNATAQITAPINSGGLTYIGKISICQDDPWEYVGKISICQGTVTDIPQSLLQNNRRTANVWSDWRRR